MKSIRLFVILLAALSLVKSPGATAQDSAAGEFKVVLIGTGIPLLNPDRACAATLVVAGERKFLVDTGRGSLMRLYTTGNLDLSAVLYTHFHNDHISELGEIMANRAINGATTPMRVLGPKGTERVANELLAPYREDTEYRVAHHGEHFSAEAMTVDVGEFDPGVIYDADGLVIRMFDVDHDPVRPAVGYRFDYAGQSIVISGDTKKTAAMTEMAKDCDVLVHEAMNARILNPVKTALKNSDPRRAAMLEDLMTHHTDTLEVAEIAHDAGVKKLVLTHLVPSIPPTEAAEDNFVRGMSDVFSGEIIMGRDGMTIAP